MQHRNTLELPRYSLSVVLILIGALGVSLAFGADALGLGGGTGIGPKQIALAFSGLAFLAAGIAGAVSEKQRVYGEWFLLGISAVAVAFAADLLVIGGLPNLWTKQLLLASVAVGWLITANPPLVSFGPQYVAELADLIAREKRSILQFLLITVQLGFLALLIRQFELENQALYQNVTLITFYGFILHAILPRQYRLPFFLLLSLTGIVGILGVQNGLWLIGIGLGLFGIAHLPIAFRWRVILLLVVGGGLAALRSGWLASSPVPNAIWPILGSMFMFRLAIYLYDLKYKKKTEGFTTRISYFFLLPNIVFPLFPVIDYATYRDKYYSADSFHIYQRGVKWLFWGTMHLITYRFVNYYLIIAPETIVDIGDLVRYIAANIMSLVRVSGQFHTAVGILMLFGFNLPKTMREFFLAFSFTDFWRRANIYWKDFMLKLFHYPTYFSLRKYSASTRLIISTAFVFFITWFLHSYQWFWLRGTFPITATDVVYWGLFGVFVLSNSLYETKRGQKRSLKKKQSWRVREFAVLSLKVVATFSIVAVLFSIWTSSSLQEWFSLWSVLRAPIRGFETFVPIFVVIAALVVGLLVSEVLNPSQGGLSSKSRSGKTSPFQPAVVYGGLILLVFSISHPAVTSRLGGRAQEVIEDLRVARLSDRDAALLLRGYYEDLIGINQFNTDLWEIYTKRPSDWPTIQETEAARLLDDFRAIELIPNQSIIFHGKRLSVNQWGMRDKDYAKTPPEGTYRAVLIGPSFVMGSGVADEEVFDWVLEERLNQYPGAGYQNYEILNFGVSGYSAPQELFIYEQQGLSFSPDALFYVAHQFEESIAVRNLANRAIAGSDIPYPFLQDVIAQAGVKPGMTQSEAERLLRPYTQDILMWTYQRLVALSREQGVLPVWIFIPSLESPLDEEILARLTGFAQEAGFITLDLSRTFEGQDIADITVAEWDKHPNERGHQLIARNFYQAILDEPSLAAAMGLK